MPRPVVVFDLDGTIVDTAPDLLASLDFVMREFGFAKPQRPRDLSIIGKGSRAMIEQALVRAGETFDEPLLARMHEAFLAHYEANICNVSAPYPGAVETFDRLADAGVALAVCTNKLEGLSVRLLEALGLARRFTAIVGADTLGVRKPDPAHVLGTIARAGGGAERAVMVGDSRFDILAAQAAGIPVVAFDFGYADTPVATLDPDVVLSGYEGLWDALRTMLELDALPTDGRGAA